MGWYVGILPAVFGTTLSIIMLVVVASPVLAPVVLCVLPFLQRRCAALKGTTCYMWSCFVALWCGLALLLVWLWDLGVMQVVIGVIMSQAIMVVVALLAIIPCLVYAIPLLKQKVLEFPSYVKTKLWEIPPAVLPLVESMMKGLLEEMERRILEKLKDMPKDVAHAVTHVGGAAVDMTKKGLSSAKSGLTSARSMGEKSEGHGRVD